MSGLPLRLVVGLGNPGERYARTRHNAGFWLVDELARRHGGTFRLEARHQAELARVSIDGFEVWLAKPQSFMNRSGAPVQSLAGFYRVPPLDILVAHDDLDLPTGTLKLKEAGGHGGHNGLRDCIATIGENFWRLRMGIGHPGEKSDVVDFVLMKPAVDEERELRASVDRAADILPVLLADGAQKAMNKLHQKAL